MNNRREALTGAMALLLQAAVNGQTQSRAGNAPVFKHDLPNVNLENWEVTVSYVDYAPGRVGAPHRHAGFVLAYVLEGTVIAKITGQPETTYKAGQMFYEFPAKYPRSFEERQCK